jgi:hypothetical protein
VTTLGILLSGHPLLETAETFLHWLGCHASIAQARIFAMLLSLGLPGGGIAPGS